MWLSVGRRWDEKERGRNRNTSWKAEARSKYTGWAWRRKEGTGRLRRKGGRICGGKMWTHRRHRKMVEWKCWVRSAHKTGQWCWPLTNSRKRTLGWGSSQPPHFTVVFSWIIFQLAYVSSGHLFLPKPRSRHYVSITYLFVLTKNAECFHLSVHAL